METPDKNIRLLWSELVFPNVGVSEKSSSNIPNHLTSTTPWWWQSIFHYHHLSVGQRSQLVWWEVICRCSQLMMDGVFLFVANVPPHPSVERLQMFPLWAFISVVSVISVISPVASWWMCWRVPGQRQERDNIIQSLVLFLVLFLIQVNQSTNQPIHQFKMNQKWKWWRRRAWSHDDHIMSNDIPPILRDTVMDPPAVLIFLLCDFRPPSCCVFSFFAASFWRVYFSGWTFHSDLLRQWHF